MSHWECCKCKCDYDFDYTDPEVIGGYYYCPMCAADPQQAVNKTSKPLHPVFWLMLGFLFGMIVAQIIR